MTTLSRGSAAICLVVGAVLLVGGCAGEDTDAYCQDVGVVFSSAAPAATRLTTMERLGRSTDGQEARDWAALHDAIEASSTSGGDLLGDLDDVIVRLEESIAQRCGSTPSPA
ncbi:hypothetical protein [Janibacter sp. G56]|uniref:hypothetical protein n=1 Tax=Janibacter sp. G56 TaxID=3418717 RepID=UPI003D029932